MNKLYVLHVSQPYAGLPCYKSSLHGQATQPMLTSPWVQGTVALWSLLPQWMVFIQLAHLYRLPKQPRGAASSKAWVTACPVHHSLAKVT